MKHDIVVIGGSLGGIEALQALLAQLPSSINASILVVLHLHPSSPGVLDKILNKVSALPVKFARHEEPPLPGTVYLAPIDHHLLLQQNRMILTHGPRENRARPAIDPLFRSAAVAYGGRVIGVILSGMLDDGAAGLNAIKECGGLAVVQEPRDAFSNEMPLNAMRAAEVDHAVPIAEMGELLLKLIDSPANAQVLVPDYLQKEVSLMKGVSSSDMENDILGELVPFVCPDCGGSLSELKEKLPRYRCHEGHVFSPLSLLNAQWDRVEYSLWSAVRILDEQANMLQRLSRKAARSMKGSSLHFENRASEIQDHAERIREFLYSNAEEKT